MQPAKQLLVARLLAVHPGWKEFDNLLSLVHSLDFKAITFRYVGDFIASGERLVFCASGAIKWPAWLPTYVSALYGVKADYCENEGGYAWRFTNEPARMGALFSPAGNDQQFGFPLFEFPNDTYPFQANASGATFFLNKDLHILYPSSNEKQFEVLDSLEDFTKTNIRQALRNGNRSPNSRKTGAAEPEATF